MNRANGEHYKFIGFAERTDFFWKNGGNLNATKEALSAKTTLLGDPTNCGSLTSSMDTFTERGGSFLKINKIIKNLSFSGNC